MGRKKPRFHCKTEAQKKAIKISYAKKVQETPVKKEASTFPDKFPFWARLKINKNRTTLVIDETIEENKKTKKVEEHFVHRESIHSNEDGSNVKGFELVTPNPDPDDERPMYLKRATKLPKRLFKPHNKDLNMPKHLSERYAGNNKKE